MITYEQICERNKLLFEALETLTALRKDNELEAEDQDRITRQITAIKDEIDINLNKMEVFIRKSSDYIPPTVPQRDHQKVLDVDTGKVYNCIHAAAKSLGINEGLLKKMLYGKTKNWTMFVIPGAKVEIEYY